GRALLARELELRARLEGDRRALARERDHAPILLLGLPAVALGQPAQHGLDAARAGEGRGPAARTFDRDLFVLRADHPALARLARPVELLDELVDRLDGDGLRAGPEVGHRGGRTLASRFGCRKVSRGARLTGQLPVAQRRRGLRELPRRAGLDRLLRDLPRSRDQFTSSPQVCRWS